MDNPVDKDYAVGQVQWIYPSVQTPPKGQKLALLTRGGIQVTGMWRAGGDFIAWQYLFRRDKNLERSDVILKGD